MTETPESLRIVRVRVRNTMKVSLVDIVPRGSTVTLGGDNGAGKSSVLEAIRMLCGGRRVMPERPIRAGARRAQQLMILRDAAILDGDAEERPGDIVVERVITENSDRLVVRAAGGDAFKAPQAMLDQLFTSLTFDPVAFVKQKPDVQERTLRTLLGLDFSELDQRRARLFADRTEAGRGREAAAARVKAVAGPFPDAPAEPVSVAVLSRELERRLAQAAEKGAPAWPVERQAVRCGRGSRSGRSKAHVESVERLKEQLQDAARGRFLEAESALAELTSPPCGAQRGSRCTCRHLQGGDRRHRRRRPGGADESLADVERVNAQVKANADRRALEAEARAAGKKWDDLTDAIDAIDAEKARTLAAATFPVEGLSIGAGGVLYKGPGDAEPIPFSQASTGIQIRVSVAVGLALNPQVKVLFVRDGSGLDASGLKLVGELAAAAGGQVWIEDCRTTDPDAIIIENGHVRGEEPDPVYDSETPEMGGYVSIDGDGNFTAVMPVAEDVRPPAGSSAPPGTEPPPPRPTPAVGAAQGGLFGLATDKLTPTVTTTSSGVTIERTARPPGAKRK
jgi:hypothetical protein